MLKIIEKTKIWFSISLIIIIVGLGFACVKGLNFGIDFKGGSEITIDMEKKFDKTEADKIIAKYDKTAQSNVVGDTQLEIKGKSMSEDNISAMFKEIKEKYSLKSNAPASEDNIGPTLGTEMMRKAVMALIIANIFMLIYVSVRFQFKFAVAAIIALVHDILVTIAVYGIFQIPVDMGFIAAMLTVIGYSINDTIVVFDRIRENMKYSRKAANVAVIANASITQTLLRSIYTVLTVIITLVAVYVFVPSVRNFTIPLLVGIASGCYSSIFIASPLWVLFMNMGKAKKNPKPAVAK